MAGISNIKPTLIEMMAIREKIIIHLLIEELS
jgi:hypothetical protein